MIHLSQQTIILHLEVSAGTVSKAANFGSKLSGIGKIQKLILDT